MDSEFGFGFTTMEVIFLIVAVIVTVPLVWFLLFVLKELKTAPPGQVPPPPTDPLSK